MIGHIRHPRDLRQSVCGLPAADVRRWETEYPPRIDYTCEDCYTLLPEAARPDDFSHPPGDATLIDTLRRIVADRQYAKVDGVLVDVWSASVTVLIWDRLRDDKRQRLLTYRRTSSSCTASPSTPASPETEPASDQPRQAQWFHSGPQLFSIDTAQALIATAPRDTRPPRRRDVCDRARPDAPRRSAPADGQSHRSGPQRLDPAYAMSGPGQGHRAATRPAAHRLGTPPLPLLARRLPRLPAHLLTPRKPARSRTPGSWDPTEPPSRHLRREQRPESRLPFAYASEAAHGRRRPRHTHIRLPGHLRQPALDPARPTDQRRPVPQLPPGRSGTYPAWEPGHWYWRYATRVHIGHPLFETADLLADLLGDTLAGLLPLIHRL